MADYFAAHPDSLLVLDNVADPALLRAPVTPGLTPVALPCRVLFTTRRRDLGDFQRVEVSVLPEAPGLRLLLRHAAAPACARPGASRARRRRGNLQHAGRAAAGTRDRRRTLG